jgi:L-fuconolactonase
VIVDAHAHASLGWYEPVEALIAAMDRGGVGLAVLVQIMGEFDNGYVVACARRDPDRFRVVVLVDHRSPAAIDHLERLVGEGAAGVRLVASARSPGRDPFALWRAAGRLRVPVSAVGDAHRVGDPEFGELVASVPETAIVLEHLGGANVPDDGGRKRQAFALARFPNVFIKLPGMGELVERSDVLTDVAGARSPNPLVRQAIDAFGPARVMWGSDFPLVSAREGYTNALESARRACAWLAPADQALIFGGVAHRLFGFGGAPADSINP